MYGCHSFAGAISLISVGILLFRFGNVLDKFFDNILDGDAVGIGVEVGKNTVPHNRRGNGPDVVARDVEFAA